MIVRHLQFSVVVAIFLAVAALFVHQAADDTEQVFQWGVYFIMGTVGCVLGGVLAYDNWW